MLHTFLIKKIIQDWHAPAANEELRFRGRWGEEAQYAWVEAEAAGLTLALKCIASSPEEAKRLTLGELWPFDLCFEQSGLITAKTPGTPPAIRALSDRHYAVTGTVLYVSLGVE